MLKRHIFTIDWMDVCLLLIAFKMNIIPMNRRLCIAFHCHKCTVYYLPICNSEKIVLAKNKNCPKRQSDQTKIRLKGERNTFSEIY